MFLICILFSIEKDETINPNNNDIIYTISSEVYAKLLIKEYTIDRQLTIHDSEDNVVPIVKPALEVKNHKIRTKQKKY